MGTPVAFRPHAAQPYDDRILSWDHDGRTVSIWTLEGRRIVPFTGAPEHLHVLAAHRKGESDLFRDRAGRWFLVATIDTRRSLRTRGTKSAKRRPKNRSGRELRFTRDVNHQISKRIVETAQRTGQGVAVEKLTGLRDRVRHRKPQRSRFHSWAFAQLGAFLAYKAERAGAAFTRVDPRNTSRECSGCAYTEKNNRSDQATFACRSCGVSLHADHDAAINIAARGLETWGRSQPSRDAV